MRLRMLPAVIVVVGLPLVPSAASAGGWWSGIDLDGSHLGIGESLTFRSEVMFRTLEAAERARTSGDFGAYLTRGFDRGTLREAMTVAEPKHWWSPPPDLTLIGDVRLSDWDANLAVATAEIDVPEVTPGSYDLMICDAGCVNPLANLIPSRIEVSADALTAQTARKMEKTKTRLDIALQRVRHDLRQQGRRLEAATTGSAESADAIARLQKRVSSLDDRPPPPSSPWLPYLSFFLAGAAVTSLVSAFRRRSSSGRPPEPPMPRIPDDARELVTTR